MSVLPAACQVQSGPAGDGSMAERMITDSIRALVNDFIASSDRLEFPVDRLADDLTWYSHGRRWDRIGFEEILAGNQGALQESRSILVGEPDIRVLGPKAAVAAYRVVETLLDTAGTELEFPHAVTQVWAHGPGGWKLAHVHVSSGGGG